MEACWNSIDQVVEEIMNIHRCLPPRPEVDEVEAARALIKNVDKEGQARIDVISLQCKDDHVPEELFFVLQEMRRSFVCFQSREMKREALKLLDLENFHALFDQMVQRASCCLSPSDFANESSTLTWASQPSVTTSPPLSTSSETCLPMVREQIARDDDSYVDINANHSFCAEGTVGGLGSLSPPQILDSTLNPDISAPGQEGEKLSLIKLASLFEVCAKKWNRELNLQNKLMDQIQWLPDSIGKLSSVMSLDLSENRIVSLPDTIGGMVCLTKLDLHCNRIAQLPDSVGDLVSLLLLDLSCNQLSSLPPTLSKLVNLKELHLSSNQLSFLPEWVGSLVGLEKLNVEANEIVEIPHSIGYCSSLKEIVADYNRLKALPEAVGKIKSLEVVNVRYNNIKQLPTTMSSLLNLKELDVSFNELESVPESLCYATSLRKLNLGNNFADLQNLPLSIGNLENLEELNISNNQIRVLPDSFKLLTRLRLLRAEENPLQVPPRHIAQKGAQAVVQYMAENAEKKEVKEKPMKQKKSWVQICFCSKSNKRKRHDLFNLAMNA